MLKLMPADLHIHTVLSACAEVEMIPPLIVSQAVRMGLSLIAVTDHNSCGNAVAVAQAAAGTGLTVLPGMELQTREEIHLLCLFDSPAACLEWQQEVSLKMPQMSNRPEFFGEQWLVDANGHWIRMEERLLAVSAEISLEAAVSGVHSLEGLAIPSHVDRPSFSLLANLGLIPEGLQADALEVTARFNPETGYQHWPSLKGWPLVVDGDAHRLKEISSRTTFLIEEASIKEISAAFRGEDGREVRTQWPGSPDS